MPQVKQKLEQDASKVVKLYKVGGCCAPNRYKETGFLFQDDGSTYSETGKKMVAISNRPMVQNITITGWYMKKFVDDHAMVIN